MVHSHRCVNSRNQRGQAINIFVNADARAHRITVVGGIFDSRRPAFPEPRNGVARGCEPRLPDLELLQQLPIWFIPKSFWGKTSIVPVSRQNAAKAACVFN